MKDYLEILNQYRDIKEICDLIDDVQKLRFYYSTQRFDLMLQHIGQLTLKYPMETASWNSVNIQPPTSYDQHYQNAEEFLKTKGYSILFEKGYGISQYLRNK